MDKEIKILERTSWIFFLIMIFGIMLSIILKGDPFIMLLIMFICLPVMFELRGEIELRKLENKKTINKPYNIYRPFTIVSMFFALVIIALKVVSVLTGIDF